jgi:hypothetical protein
LFLRRRDFDMRLHNPAVGVNVVVVSFADSTMFSVQKCMARTLCYYHSCQIRCRGHWPVNDVVFAPGTTSL